MELTKWVDINFSLIYSRLSDLTIAEKILDQIKKLEKKYFDDMLVEWLTKNVPFKQRSFRGKISLNQFKLQLLLSKPKNSLQF